MNEQQASEYLRAEGLAKPDSVRINTDKTVAVDSAVFWQPIETCPHGVKVQLLGAGGVAIYGTYTKDIFWRGWCPLPSKPEWMK